MKRFDRQVMLRLVNHNLDLSQEYQQALKNDSIDKVLSDLFLTRVIYKTELINQYESLFDDSEVPKLKQDSPLCAKIRALIAEYGWRAFVDALVEFADQKRVSTYLLGMRSTSELWKQTTAKVDTIRRTLQL